MDTILYYISVREIKELARRENKTFDDILNIIKSSITRSVIGTVRQSNIFNSITSLDDDHYLVFYINSNTNENWIGCWRTNTINITLGVNNQNLNEDYYKVISASINSILNKHSTNTNSNENRLQQKETDRGVTDDSRGIAIEDSRGEPTITSGQVSYEAISC